MVIYEGSSRFELSWRAIKVIDEWKQEENVNRQIWIAQFVRILNWAHVVTRALEQFLFSSADKYWQK